MKNKLIYCLNFLWASIIAFSFPVCFALIYLSVTGHSKGYDYDLGQERDISVMLGIFGLVIWLAAALPSNIYVFRKTREKSRLYLLIPAVIYIALAALCIVLTGGWAEYSKGVFNT